MKDDKKASIKKSYVSVSEMAQQLQISRARFYQLLTTGFFPQPVYCPRTKRPYFNQELQEKCLQIRQTGIGENGELMMFYRSRKTTVPKRHKNAKSHNEIVDALLAMGVKCSGKQIENVIEELYPQGLDDRDQGLVIREIYRCLMSKS